MKSISPIVESRKLKYCSSSLPKRIRKFLILSFPCILKLNQLLLAYELKFSYFNFLPSLHTLCALLISRAYIFEHTYSSFRMLACFFSFLPHISIISFYYLRIFFSLYYSDAVLVFFLFYYGFVLLRILQI